MLTGDDAHDHVQMAYILLMFAPSDERVHDDRLGHLPHTRLRERRSRHPGVLVWAAVNVHSKGRSQQRLRAKVLSALAPRKQKRTDWTRIRHHGYQFYRPALMLLRFILDLASDFMPAKAQK